MFWSRKEPAETAGDSVADRVAIEAEGFYRSGKIHCAEAVLLAVRNNFRPEVPDEVVQLAGGFGGGSGVGCLCGAVSGGTMALGLVLKDDKKRVKELTKELHHWFKGEYGATCCKVILQSHKKIGPLLTGKVAGKVAELLMAG
ncbi:MAG: C-GCAxxG-C-C family protein [Geobacteraceae bacterium]|nr:C-GCAxxG-C-C family protein [Geobacteraceae bacterium]